MNAYPIENDKCTADVELEAFAVPNGPRARTMALENHLFRPQVSRVRS